MPIPILATKLYIPPSRPSLVHRARLIERLNAGLHGKVTLISAPAGFGKTTLLSEWVEELRIANTELRVDAETKRPLVTRNSKIVNQVAWLSLDADDSDPTRFLIYLVAALQTIASQIGAAALSMLQSPQPPPVETILTSLLNDVSGLQQNFLLVLDDYHLIDSKRVDEAFTFLIEHLPPQMHLVIATREDPPVPLARLRARGQLNEVRAADLRFTPDEAAEFLNRGMGLALTAEEIIALDKRTEGWIAGLQLAALSMQGPKEGGKADVASFIQSFTGSHRFVMDYLVEEVLHQQSADVQHFLLYTSILERLCGPLCEAVIGDWRVEIGDSVVSQSPISNPQSPTFLEYLEQANLFIIPLDSERRWYRYHHLFAELLRQRLQQSFSASGRHALDGMNELHIRASQWYEENGLEIEAFHHAAAANDIERAERLIEGKGIPLHLRGAVIAVLNWLESLPTSVLNARPSLWWRFASLLLVNGQTTGVEEKLNAAEAALPSGEPDDKTRLLIGRIAAARGVLALTRYQVESMITQSRRALEYLPVVNLFQRANATWTLGYAYLFAGNRSAARKTLSEAITLSQTARDTFTTILATIGLGIVQESENQLHLAAETYRQVLQLAGEQPLQIICEAHLGLARVSYEWNDLETAERHGEQSLHLAKQYERVIDRFIASEVFLARLKLAQGDVTGAAEILEQADQAARQRNFVLRIPEVAAAQVIVYLCQGNLSAADQLAQTHKLPIGQARVHLAQGDPSAALAILVPFQQRMEANGWADERIKAMILRGLALQAKGDKQQALQLLAEVLALAEPSGFVRLFVDEGLPMAGLLKMLKREGFAQSAYIDKLLSAFNIQVSLTTSPLIHSDEPKSKPHPSSLTPPPLIEPLSEREREVLRLIAQGLSNQEICSRLFLALSTVKGHNQRIFDKLQVQRRTEAIARAQELGII